MLKNRYFNIALINDTSLNRHYGCHFLMKEMNILFKKKNFFVNKRIFNDDLDILSEVKKIKSIDIDLALVNGEGTLHGQENHKVNEILQSVKFIKTILNKKVFLINSTIADLDDNQLSYFQYFDKIYVREFSSYKFLRDNNIFSQIVPDILSITDFNINKKKIGKKIMFNDSSIKNLQINLSSKHKIENHNILYYNRVEYILLKVYLKFKTLNFIYNYLQFIKNLKAHKFLKEILSSKFLITGRFHAMLICFALKVPFFAYKSISSKIEGVLKDANLESRYKTVNELNTLNYNEYDLKDDEIKKIDLYKKNSFLKIQNMFNEIRKIISE